VSSARLRGWLLLALEKDRERDADDTEDGEQQRWASRMVAAFVSHCSPTVSVIGCALNFGWSSSMTW
jgi:hypothetical protein